jgi:hypothetical protein
VKKLLRQLRTNKLSGTIVRSVAKLGSITFLSLAFSYWIDYLGFITKGKLTIVLITPSLGVPNWSVIYIINTAPSRLLQTFGGMRRGTFFSRGFWRFHYHSSLLRGRLIGSRSINEGCSGSVPFWVLIVTKKGTKSRHFS